VIRVPKQIIDMLLLECEWANVEIKKEFVVNEVDKDNNEYCS
jgi:predicted flavoprotein YhiN